jgi:hypothetical protein
MQVGDLVRQKYPHFKQVIGLVLEISECGDVLVSWPDHGGKYRNHWHQRGYLWRIK